MASVRAVRVQKPSWANVRTALGLVLFCVALVAGQRMIAGAQDTVQVWVAAADLPADAVVSGGDVRAEDVRLPDDLIGNYVLADTTIEGLTLSRPVLEGEMVASSVVSGGDDPTGGGIVTLSSEKLGQGSAGLGPGDRIDIIATFDSGDVRSETVPVVRGAEVLEVVTSEGFVGGSDVAGVRITVPDELVGLLSFASHNAVLDVVEVSGGGGLGERWSVTREDL